MQKNARRRWFYVFLLPVMFAGTLAVAADPERVVAVPPVVPDSECCAAMAVAPVTTAAPLPVAGSALESTPAADSEKCCDPALEPGVGGNPLCFEGHTCCASGQWQCNNADGSPSCTGGQTCGATCGTSGASCNANTDCCSGQCKGNHKCR